MPQLQTGTWRGEIVGHKVGETPKAGIPCAYLTIKVDKGVQSDGVEYDLPEPQNRTMSMLLSDNAAEYTMADLKLLGFNGTLSEFNEGTALVGKRGEFYNQIKNDYENWRVSRPRSGAPQRPSLDSNALLDLDAKFGHLFGQTAAPATANSAAPAASSDSDGDIPF
jgi:hypothetical protein